MINYKKLDSIDRITEETFGLLLNAKTAALSFGSTYEGIFTGWKALWEKAERPALPAFFPADERLVDINDAGSNWGMVRKSFLNTCGTPDDRGRWASDADVYRKFLTARFGDALPVFDLVFLGLGPDGHTASLFPADCPNIGDSAWMKPVLSTTAPFTPPERLTLGPELIAQAEELVLTVTGAGKADIFSQLRSELGSVAGNQDLPPVRIIRRRQKLGLKTLILCDSEAYR